jgi:hypothetical protein
VSRTAIGTSRQFGGALEEGSRIFGRRTPLEPPVLVPRFSPPFLPCWLLQRISAHRCQVASLMPRGRAEGFFPLQHPLTNGIPRIEWYHRIARGLLSALQVQHFKKGSAFGCSGNTLQQHK